jgi:hypothetical protein
MNAWLLINERNKDVEMLGLLYFYLQMRPYVSCREMEAAASHMSIDASF